MLQEIRVYESTLLIGLKLENRTEDYDGDLVFTGFDEESSTFSTSSSEQQPLNQFNQPANDISSEEMVGTAESAESAEPATEAEVEQATGQSDTEEPANVEAISTQIEEAITEESAVSETVPVETATVETTEIFTENGVEMWENPQTLRERAIAKFLYHLIKHCNDVKRVYMDKEENSNEKFAMRAWFTQLGWKGKEDNELRSYFYDRLEGNTAFQTEEDHARWAAKWQPKYFEKHPEMKWVLEEVEKTKEAETPAAEEKMLAEEAEVEAAATVDTEMPIEETAQEEAQETAQEAIEEAEAVETATEPVAETEISSEAEKVKKVEDPEAPEESDDPEKPATSVATEEAQVSI